MDRAIELYSKILDSLEGKPELSDELGLFNKLGDLFLRQGDVPAAVRRYEQAVKHYAEHGFPNNAIALCNKVLRNAPGRTHVYLKLAMLMMQRGFVPEAKQNLLEYAERMEKAGRVEESFSALNEFADHSPDNQEIRLMLAEQLRKAARTDEAREQLAMLYHEVRATGDEQRTRTTLDRMKAIDPDYDVEGAPLPVIGSKREKAAEIVFIDLDDESRPVVVDTRAEMGTRSRERLGAESSETPDGASVGTLDIEPTALTEVEPPAALTISALEAMVEDDPEAPEPHRELGEALVEAGERERGRQELDTALDAYEASNDWQHAQTLAEEILRLDPNSLHHHQKRVEYALRSDDSGRVTQAYLGLADALLRSGEVERAKTVYERVLQHDVDNEAALAALATLATLASTDPHTEPAALEGPVESAGSTAAEDDGFVDLGALLLEGEPVRDTRIRIQQEAPSGDEERDFQHLLAEFKKGISANLAIDDTEAHYDLGMAFRGMGLLDEAIAEFQKALRGSDGRLKTAEALGGCFHDKGQFAVGGIVLSGAIESEPGGDSEKIGLLYWRGRCEEAQGHGRAALDYYHRVLSIDIDFQDVGDRVSNLAQTAG